MSSSGLDNLLRPLDEVLRPDPRFEKAVYLKEDGIRLYQLADRHRELSLVALKPEVPDDVRGEFQTALNLMLYAWFVFEFHTVAERQAYSALELSLRTKFPAFKVEGRKKNKNVLRRPMLHDLLQHALEVNALDAREMPAWDRHKKWYAEAIKMSPGAIAPLPTPETWLKEVVEDLPDSRNHISHGNPHLYPYGSTFALNICADLINAIFTKRVESTPIHVAKA